MNEENPYAAPKSNTIFSESSNDRLEALNFEQVKKLYYRSCNVSGLVGLLCLGFMAIVGLLLFSEETESTFVALFVGLAVFYGLAIVGLFNRTSWGRVLGIIICILSLLQIPIGTIIGLMGLFAFFGSPELFGENRLTHKELKAEFNLRKFERKTKRR